MTATLQWTREDVLDHFLEILNPGSPIWLIADEADGSNWCPPCSRIYRALLTLSEYMGGKPDAD